MNDLLHDIRTLERMETSFNKIFTTSKNVERDNAINDVYLLLKQMKIEKQSSIYGAKITYKFDNQSEQGVD